MKNQAEPDARRIEWNGEEEPDDPRKRLALVKVAKAGDEDTEPSGDGRIPSSVSGNLDDGSGADRNLRDVASVTASG